MIHVTLMADVVAQTSLCSSVVSEMWIFSSFFSHICLIMQVV